MTAPDYQAEELEEASLGTSGAALVSEKRETEHYSGSLGALQGLAHWAQQAAGKVTLKNQVPRTMQTVSKRLTMVPQGAGTNQMVDQVVLERQVVMPQAIRRTLTMALQEASKRQRAEPLLTGMSRTAALQVPSYFETQALEDSTQGILQAADLVLGLLYRKQVWEKLPPALRVPAQHLALDASAKRTAFLAFLHWCASL